MRRMVQAAHMLVSETGMFVHTHGYVRSLPGRVTGWEVRAVRSAEGHQIGVTGV